MSLSETGRNSIALAAVCLVALMFGLEISSVPVILPTLEQVLHSDFKDVQWIMNAYTIACTTVLMAAGTLADRYGRRRMLTASLALFGLTSLVCGLAPSAPVLIAARFLQGLGGGAMMIGQFAILSHQFRDGAQRARAFAVWGIVAGLGLGFGPIVGAAIVALSDWQWVFLVHVPLTLLTLALIRGSVQESRDPQAKTLDLPGMVTLSLAVFALSFFITQGPDLGFASPAALGVLAGAALCFAAFLFAERRHPHPMFDFSVFRVRNFSGAIMGSIGMNFSFWPFMIYLPIWFQSGLGYGVVPAGLALLAYTLPTLVIPPLAERLSLRYQPRRIIPLGLSGIGLGFVLMRWGSAAAHPGWLSMLPGCLVAGIGLGLTNTPVTNTTTGSVSSDRAGMASGIDMSARLITLAINIAMMGFILLEGILSSLEQSLHGAADAAQLHALAGQIAAGRVLSPGGGTELPGAVIHAALARGFGWVMLYGGAGVWLLAGLSFVIFRPGQRRGVGDGRRLPQSLFASSFSRSSSSSGRSGGE
jgi:EmrB/QacA subfamily drug resistance transporter